MPVVYDMSAWHNIFHPAVSKTGVGAAGLLWLASQSRCQDHAVRIDDLAH